MQLKKEILLAGFAIVSIRAVATTIIYGEANNQFFVNKGHNSTVKDIVTSVEQNRSLNSSSDKFLKLKSLFENSRAASFYDITGVYEGRCYYKFTFENGYDINYLRDNGLFKILAVIEEKSDIDHGPLFPDKVKEILFSNSRSFNWLKMNELIREMKESRKWSNEIFDIVAESPLVVRRNYSDTDDHEYSR